MNISIPDALASYVQDRARRGGYESADAFVADLVSTESAVMEQLSRGEPLAVDARFDQRLSALLDEAAEGEYVDAGPGAFDAMEQEALSLLASRQRN